MSQTKVCSAYFRSKSVPKHLARALVYNAHVGDRLSACSLCATGPRCLLLTFCLSVSGVQPVPGTSTGISDTAVESVVISLDDGGNVLEELEGIIMVF